MSTFKPSLLIAVLTLWFGAAWAQTGTLTGTFTDATTGEPVPTAYVIGPNNNGTTTDFDGIYTLTLPVGTQKVLFKIVGYTDSTYTVTITEGQTTTLNHKGNTQTTRLGVVTAVGGKFKKELGEEIVTVEVLDRNIIDNSSAFDMDEAMEKVPGVTIVDGQANIRGGSGWSYGAGSRVLVLVDDIPLMTADAADVKWSFIPTENVEQVEVVKGAASALYGSSALNGVINVITAWPKNEPYTKVIMYSGFTENPRDGAYVWWGRNQPLFGGGNIVHRQKFGQWDFVSSASYNTTKSHLQDGSNQEVRATIKLRHRPSKVKGLSYGVNLNGYNSTGSTFFLWDGIDSSIYKPLPGSTSEYSTFRLTVDPFITYFDKHDNRYKLTARYFNALNTNNTGQGSLPQLYYGEFQYQRRFNRLGLNVVGGIAGYYADVRPPGGSDGTSLIGKHNGSNFAAYAQVEKKFFDKLTLGFGVRYEYFRIDTFKSDALPVFRFGVNYQAAAATFIRASIGQGYRFPTMAEKFVRTNVGGIGIYPNPNLQPEKGWSAEIGIKQGLKLGKWLGYVDVAGFINQYNNMMEFTFGQFGDVLVDPLFGLGFSSQNIGDTRILGLETTLIGQGEIANKFPLQILAGYTYIDPRSLNWNDTLVITNLAGTESAFAPGFTRDAQPTYAGTSSSETNMLKYRFRHTIKLDAQIGVKKFEFGVSLQYVSFMENIDYLFVSQTLINLSDPADPIANPPLIDTKAFSGLREYRKVNERGNTLLDLRIAYNISPKIKISAICKNVLNQDQMERPAYMSQPRNYTTQLSVEF